MKNKKLARCVSHTAAHALFEAGVPADDIADAMLTSGLAAWCASIGDAAAGEKLLAAWVDLRDMYTSEELK